MYFRSYGKIFFDLFLLSLLFVFNFDYLANGICLAHIISTPNGYDWHLSNYSLNVGMTLRKQIHDCQ